MRRHRPLRHARRAARVEDRGELARLQTLDCDRLAVGQRIAGREGERRAGVVHDVGDLLVGEARVDGHDDSAEQLRAEERKHPVAAVWQAQRNAIAARDARLTQPTGDTCGTVPQLAVAQRVRAELDDRRRGAVALDARAQHLHERVGAVAVEGAPVGVALHAAVIERVAASRGRLDRLLDR
jgi:hypothetical protein